MDAACSRAIYAKAISYYRIKNRLENNLDKITTDDLDKKEPPIPTHENIRGHLLTNKQNNYDQ
ncbi:hypothetical protein [uncultured Cyclobacterium sp.]|uniref:hypothetical protein n=1 Tax=uncultured Cyclobacterium sp. TaxID=453820 RepID=UPI0030EB29F1